MDSSGQGRQSLEWLRRTCSSMAIWVAPDASGCYRLSGAYRKLKELLGCRGKLVEVARRSRPRLAKALHVVGHVGVCAVSGPVLLACMADVMARRDLEQALDGVTGHDLLGCCPYGQRDDGVVARVPAINGWGECEHDGMCVCDDLVYHLAQYAMFRKRTHGLLLALTDRAVSWRERMGEREACFLKYAPLSIMLAFGFSESEDAAVKMLNSTRVRKAVRATENGLRVVPDYDSYGQAFAQAGWGGAWRLFGQRRTTSNGISA